MGYYKTGRDFHEARWDEPVILELGEPGQRGVLVPEADPEIMEKTGDMDALLPLKLCRRNRPRLPELSQMQVLRHYMRLSQEVIGTDINIDIGLGTCTMKYSPKINEQLVRSEKLQELHPCQDESTVQGILEIMYRTEQFLKAISGMDRVCLQPSGGSQAIFSNVQVIRAYHESRGEGAKRNEIITTMLSHPANPGTAATLGYRVLTLMPGPDGLPAPEDLKKLLSEHTAGLLITNPEDTGIYNPRIREFVDLVNEAGGLCVYDQANQNGLFGITRAADAGFDMCSYNLHKSFSSPHGCQGPGTGAQCVKEFLAPFLPSPRVTFDGQMYHLEQGGPESVGKLRKFYGVPAVLVRTYAYIRSLGPDGLKAVSETAILNNNYLIKKLLGIPGLSLPYGSGRFRMEQARLSWEELTKETGVTTDDICRRIVDYGFQDYFASHHPRIIPEPFTPEPAESYSKDDIDEFIAAFRAIAEEARTDPELVKTAPHRAALSSQIHEDWLDSWDHFATTWRAYKKHKKKEAEGSDI